MKEACTDPAERAARRVRVNGIETILIGAALLALLSAGCKMAPKEIRAIQSENELLREQIGAMRRKCTYYREIEIEALEEQELKQAE